MMNVKDTFISLNGIRSVRFDNGRKLSNQPALVIQYFDGMNIIISVNDEEDYLDWANEIIKKINERDEQ